KRRPPRSTLIPYTTLFRSAEGATKFITIRVEEAGSQDEALRVAYAVAHSPLVKTAFYASDPNLGRILAAVGYAGIEDLDVQGVKDRKSTRLNSSHVKISYA